MSMDGIGSLISVKSTRLQSLVLVAACTIGPGSLYLLCFYPAMFLSFSTAKLLIVSASIGLPLFLFNLRLFENYGGFNPMRPGERTPLSPEEMDYHLATRVEVVAQNAAVACARPYFVAILIHLTCDLHSPRIALLIAAITQVAMYLWLYPPSTDKTIFDPTAIEGAIIRSGLSKLGNISVKKRITLFNRMSSEIEARAAVSFKAANPV